jgi:hypothetical protein
MPSAWLSSTEQPIHGGKIQKNLAVSVAFWKSRLKLLVGRSPIGNPRAIRHEQSWTPLDGRVFRKVVREKPEPLEFERIEVDTRRLKRMNRLTTQGREKASYESPLQATEAWINRRASDQATRAANARQISGRRRFVDPTTCERDYSQAEMEFMLAMNEYKQKSGRMFPTWSEVLEVLRALGYEKVVPVGDAAEPAIPDASTSKSSGLPESRQKSVRMV